LFIGYIITNSVVLVINRDFIVTLSTKGRYASRAMLELALHYGQGPVLLRKISQRQAISERYLERLMTALITAGLVISTRGKQGGFRLARPPKEIRLSQIIQATEGSLSPVFCVDDPGQCNRTQTCVTHTIWEKLKKEMFELLDSITLEKMVALHQEKMVSSENAMYII
jgi:Rrf2 family cysteine metabolism transcriptional repressor